jgi:hypothetical protein
MEDFSGDRLLGLEDDRLCLPATAVGVGRCAGGDRAAPAPAAPAASAAAAAAAAASAAAAAARAPAVAANSRGSVIAPRIAVAAATAGLPR